MRKALLVWCLSFFLIACSHISAKRNLENIAEIQLPDGYSVLVDDYQQAGKDFYIQYNIQFDKDSTYQMIRQIKSSKFYSVDHAQTLYDSVWYVENDLYKFEAWDESVDRKYQIVFNPVNGVLNYLEYSEKLKL